MVPRHETGNVMNKVFSQQHTRLVVGHLRQSGHCGSDLLSAQAAPEGDYVRDGRRQLRCQEQQVLRALRQHQREATGLGCGDHVVTDQLIAAWALSQRLIESLELGSRIGGWEIRRAEARRANQHMVSEWPSGRLFAGVVTEAHGAALHENDGLMAVFARGRG
jgi:hypothetical protein